MNEEESISSNVRCLRNHPKTKKILFSKSEIRENDNVSSILIYTVATLLEIWYTKFQDPISNRSPNIYTVHITSNIELLLQSKAPANERSITMSETKTKSARKKRKVSKHVLNARKQDADQKNPVATEETGTQSSEKKTPQRTSGKNRHIKDPSEAMAYLNEWQNHKNSKGNWKFNKNTQSWIIRHMYEVEKISRGAFEITLDYLGGLEGTTMRSRIRAEASRRALRYKEHEKKSKADETKEKNTEETESNKATDNAADPKTSDKELMEEEQRWQKLDEHDKRKEYKRARKILETIKEWAKDFMPARFEAFVSQN